MALTRDIVRSLIPPAPTLPDPALITAVIAPVLPILQQGDSLENAVADWEDITVAGNYASTGGMITSVLVSYLGDAVDETTVLSAGQTAGYRVTVTDDGGAERVWIVDPVVVEAVAPGQVAGLVASGGNGQISLTWSAPASDGGAAITDYLIERNIAGAGWTVVADGTGTGLSFVDTGRTNGVVHQYRVSAVNAVATGSASPVDNATPSSDVTAPILSLTSWDDGTKTIDFTVSETCTLIVSTHLASATPVIDGAGGWSQATIETFTQIVSGTGTLAVTITDESAERISYYVRDAAGNDSAELITQTITFGPPARLVDHGHFTQSLNLGAIAASETTPAAFAKAGRFLVGITEVCDAVKSFTLSGSNVSAASLIVQRTTGNDDTGVHFFEVTTTAASELIITSNDAGSSFARGIHIAEMDGLASVGVITAIGNSATQSGDAGSTALLSAVPAGQSIYAIAISRRTNSISASWGGGFVSTDKVDERAINSNSRSTAALKIAASTGDFQAAPSFLGSDGSGERSTLAIALDAV